MVDAPRKYYSVGKDLKTLFAKKQVQAFFNGTPPCMFGDKEIYQHGAMRMVCLPILIYKNVDHPYLLSLAKQT